MNNETMRLARAMLTARHLADIESGGSIECRMQADYDAHAIAAALGLDGDALATFLDAAGVGSEPYDPRQAGRQTRGHGQGGI